MILLKSAGTALLGLVCLGLMMEGWSLVEARRRV